MPLEDKENSNEVKQDIVQENVEGDAKAEVTNIENQVNIEKLNIFVFSNDLEAKPYEEKDLKSWEKEDLIISINDQEMIKGIIKSEEEIKEAIPLIILYKKFFNLLPDYQKGLFITALKTINRENKVGKFVRNKNVEVPDKIIDMIDELQEQEENFSKIYSYNNYEDYKKIYNITRCKDLENKVLKKIEELEMGYNDKNKLKEEFLIYWGKRLENHPYAVFVSAQRLFKLEAEIAGKFGNEEKELVKVYAKGQNIIKGQVACKKVMEHLKQKDSEEEILKKNYEIQEEFNNIGNRNAICITFKEKH